MNLPRRPRRLMRFAHATKKRTPVRLLSKNLPLPPATEILRSESVFRIFALSYERETHFSVLRKTLGAHGRRSGPPRIPLRAAKPSEKALPFDSWGGSWRPPLSDRCPHGQNSSPTRTIVVLLISVHRQALEIDSKWRSWQL